MADIDHDKALAALEQLEAEKARRLQARVDSGELVLVQTTVVVHRDEDEEEATARAVAKHPVPDDGRHHRELFYIYTGVPRRDPDFGQWEPQVQPASKVGALSSPAAEQAGSGAAILSPPSQPNPVYVRVVVSNGGEDDPGAIVEAWYVIEDGAVVLRDADDKHIASRMLLRDDDPALLAKSLLREREASTDFNQPIRYPKLGLA
jgi:hypothetical protein